MKQTESKMSCDFFENLVKYGTGRRKLDDEMFARDKVPPRLGIYDEDDEDFYHSTVETTCFVPGCQFIAQTLLEFENHYNSNHRYACSLCKKTQPSPHILDLHIQETHDSFFAVLAEKKPSFSCYIEECKEKFLTPDLRLEHCVQVHKLPKDFRFDYKPKHKTKRQTNKNTSNMDIDNNTLNLQNNIKFTNNKTKTFCKKPFKKFTNDNIKTTVNVDIDQAMLDLQETLPT